MRYEGFEPSPYDHENARENELGTVCAFPLNCYFISTLCIARQPAYESVDCPRANI